LFDRVRRADEFSLVWYSPSFGDSVEELPSRDMLNSIATLPAPVVKVRDRKRHKGRFLWI
jgi:hypothetical protein